MKLHDAIKQVIACWNHFNGVYFDDSLIDGIKLNRWH